MLTASPGQTITISQSGIPTGQVVGVTVQKAVSDTVAIGRFTSGVVERPAGSGNYVATFVVPVEVDLYLIVMDWSGGTPTPTTSIVEELQVTSLASLADTGLGAVADRVRVALGAESFQGLLDSPQLGSASIALAIEVVKARVMTNPPAQADEGTLPLVVLSYLGKLAALELMPAVRDFWMSQTQSVFSGNDPTETVNYPSRVEMLRSLEDSLLRQVRADQALAISLVDQPLLLATGGPLISEAVDMRRVTRDPSDHPRQRDFPYRHPAGRC